MLKCMIVEDEQMAVKVLESHINSLPNLEISSVHHNAMDAITALQTQKVDVLLLDIQMPKLSGLGLLKALPQLPPVILTTAYRDYAIEGFDLDVVDYLLKPISFERFVKVIDKVHRRRQPIPEVPAAETQHQLAPDSFIYVKHQRNFVKVLLADIVYIESIKNHVRLVTAQDTLLPLISLTEMEAKLPPQHFLRVHRSFIVALAQVSSYSATHVHTTSKVLPIGRHYKQQVLDRLGSYVI
ncbi:MAG: LytTR family DNA-binding domain-containing protein [Bacteroidota bacterium]